MKETCRGMSKPGERKLRRVKRFARYLKSAKAATVVVSSSLETVRKIIFYVDSDWDGCKMSRKSDQWGGRC